MPTTSTASPALRRVGRAALLGLLILGVSVPALAQWKWRDASGKIQYSDLPPPKGTPDKDILQAPPGVKLQVFVIPAGGAASAPASAPAPKASAPTRSELEAQARQKQMEQEQAARAKEDERKLAQQKRENCKAAQDNLKLLQDGVRINTVDAKGERSLMDDAQRNEQMQRARTVIASDCR